MLSLQELASGSFIVPLVISKEWLYMDNLQVSIIIYNPRCNNLIVSDMDTKQYLNFRTSVLLYHTKWH